MGAPELQPTDNCAAIDGLEQLFQVDLEPQDQGQFQFQDQVDLVPLAEAAKRLGVSRRYAHKLAAGGRIPAQKDSAGRWLVKMEHGQVQIQDHVEPVEFQDQFQVEQTQFQFQDQVIQGYQEQVKQLQEKLEAATFRAGYLQAQLEAAQDTIKLLTDRQCKTGWWYRFCSWLVGASDR